MTWEEAVAHALSLDGAVLATHYGQGAIKANGNAFLNIGREPDTSFVLHLDPGVIEWLLAEHPDTFWKSAHYDGYPAVLVRYETARDDIVREMIASAHARALAKAAPRKRG